MKGFYTFSLLILTSIAFGQVTEVIDINGGTGDSKPQNLIVFDGAIYFSADDASGVNTDGVDYGKELWISDGTTTGTQLLKNINEEVAKTSSIFAFFELKNELYFSANDGVGSRVWKTDGTEAGTVNTNNGFSILQPVVVEDVAYMTATTEGNAFYKFDGVTFEAVPDSGVGTPLVIGGVYTALNNDFLLVYMDYVIEGGVDYGIDLYTYDIKNQNYTLLKDIAEGDGNSGISNFTLLGDEVYFEANNELWVTDGTEEGTIEVVTAKEALINGVNNFYAWNDKLFFEGDDGNGDQLWVYDPVLDTVTNISNINGVNIDHDPSDYAVYEDYLYYRGEDAEDDKGHLFRTDGASIEQVDTTIIDVDELVVLNNKIYFEGDNGNNGDELFVFDPAILSVNSVDLDSALTMYPNPTADFINVKGNFINEVSYEVHNKLGCKVQSGVVLNNRIDFDIAQGIYMITIVSDDATTTRKIIIE